MKENVVIYPSRTSLGGEKETVKGLGYNYTFLTSLFFYMDVSFHCFMGDCTGAACVFRWKEMWLRKAKEFPFWRASLLSTALPSETCASKPMLAYKACCKWRGKRHHPPKQMNNNEKPSLKFLCLTETRGVISCYITTMINFILRLIKGLIALIKIKRPLPTKKIILQADI